MKGCASSAQIQAWIEKEYGFKVSSLYVAQIQDKLGIEKRRIGREPLGISHTRIFDNTGIAHYGKA